MKSKIALFIVLFALTVVFGFSYEAEKKMSLDASGIKELNIDSGAGFLKVKGVEGAKAIEVKALIVIKGIDDDDVKSFIEDKIILKLKKKGNDAVLESRVKTNISSFFKRREVRIDVEVTMPKHLELIVDDGSGLITVSDVSGNVEIEDGSGSIDVEQIGGNLEIEDGSGTITVENVSGNVDIEDGSGEITVKKVKGNVKVDDSSGSLNILDIGGSVTVDDGSGDINIDGVDKDVVIEDDGSGSVSIKNVKGKVSK
jgi:DUF4097 and DUF4098 domain-containing protein YvlB